MMINKNATPCTQSFQYCCVLRLDELHQDWTTYGIAPGATLKMPKRRLPSEVVAPNQQKASSKGPGGDLFAQGFPPAAGASRLFGGEEAAHCKGFPLA
jgi:hypothetical protein